MTPEEKIAEIRQGVEERFNRYAATPNQEAAFQAEIGVVIYGVPLSEGEIQSLRNFTAYWISIDGNNPPWKNEDIIATWEMLERGKK